MPCAALAAFISSASQSTTPEKPSLAAQQAGDGGRGQRGGQLSGELGHPQVAGHQRHGPAGDGRGERGQVAGADVIQRAGDRGQRQVGIRRGAAVPGEVLGARGHPRGLQAGDGRGDVPGHQRRVRPERAGAHHVAAARGQDVRARRQVGVDAQPGQFRADGRVHVPGQRRVVHRTQRRIARVGAAGVEHPRHVAGFLVDGDDRLGGRSRAQGGGEAGEVPGDVRPEESDARQPFLQGLQDPARGGRAGERRNQDRVGQRAQRRVNAPIFRRGGLHSRHFILSRRPRRARWPGAAG